MMKTLLGFIFCLLIGNCVYAQKQDTISSYMKTDPLNRDGSPVPTASMDSAEFLRMVMPPDSSIDENLYPVADFYLSGKKKMSGLSKFGLVFINLQGPCVEYYRSGKKKLICNYEDGKKVGYATTYFPNGKLYTSIKYEDSGAKLVACNDSTGNVLAGAGNGKWIFYANDFSSIENEGPVKDSLQNGDWSGRFNDSVSYIFTYKDGAFESAISVDKEGKKYPYNDRNSPPEFNGGNQALSTFIYKNLKYPDLAAYESAQGFVVVILTVEKDGSVANVHVAKKVDFYLDTEAIRVIKKMPKWTPASRYGVPVSTVFSIPINFSMINPDPSKRGANKNY